MLKAQQERIAKLEVQSAELPNLKTQLAKMAAIEVHLAKLDARLTDTDSARLASAAASQGGVK